MKKNLTLALAASLLAGSAMAQVTVVSVDGLVTIGSGNVLSNIDANTKTLPEGGQLQVAEGAKITVSFPSGCTATLVAGQTMSLTDQVCQTLAKAKLPAGGGGIFARMLTPINVGLGVGSLGLLRYVANRNDDPETPTVVLPVTPQPPASGS